MLINRKKIIATINSEFISDEKVYAFWLEGADAIGTVDEYSDIDMWFDVEDGYEDMFINHIKETLINISPIEFFHEKYHNHPKIRQMFIRLSDTSKFLIIDLCIQSHSRKIEFIKEFEDEKVKVMFDKGDVIKYTNTDMNEFTQSINKRREEIIKTYEFFAVWIEKEIKRNNYLEALAYYNEYILCPLIELLRIIYAPTKSGFGSKHIKRDLPIDKVNMIEYLYKISSIEEIGKKTREAISYFHEHVN